MSASSLALLLPVVLTDGRLQEDLMLEDTSSGQATVCTEEGHFNPHHRGSRES